LDLAKSFSICGVQILTKLKKLQRFTFCFYEGHYQVVEMGSMLAQNLPWLKRLEQPYKTPTIMKIKGVFQFKEIWAEKTLPSEATFPNLNRLNFSGPLRCRKTQDFLTSCTQLNCLDVKYLSSSDLTSFCKLTGQNLSRLELSELKSKIDLALLFHYCPNLSSFRARRVGCNRDEQSIFGSKISAHNFRLLKHFYFSFGAGVPSGIVEFLLQAPLIEEIRIPSDCVGPQLIEIAQALTFENLKHLQTFVIEHNYLSYHVECDINDLAKLFKIIVACAKNLTTCFVSCMKDRDRAMWHNRNDVKFFEALVNEHHF
jgi:hypothetical protein